MTTSARVCKNCLADPMILVPGNRPAPFPGPRCATHDRAKKRADRLSAHGRRLQAVYSITRDTYDQILEVQGGRCAICQRATGATKHLAVDHDHTCCAGPTSCGQCVRGLLCGPCNDVLGHFRDDPVAGDRIRNYLVNPPARRLIQQETHQ